MREKFDTYTARRPRTRKIVGWFLVVFGFFALIIPLIPGGVLIFIGLEVLGLRLIFTEKLRGIFMCKKVAFAPETVTVSSEESRV